MRSARKALHHPADGPPPRDNLGEELLTAPHFSGVFRNVKGSLVAMPRMIVWMR
ncbi:hypothetical protein SAMN05444678_102166 [Sphingomonas sp. YR710]|nr:hypothetical protein SAMN05444678_102166 [Sphingomonas sp. YR710]